MEANGNFILQISDLVTSRRCAVRVEQQEAGLPLRELLERYVKNPPFDDLLRQRRITQDSVETLASLQDLVYVTSDEGRLHGLYAGVQFKQDEDQVALDQVPRRAPVQINGTDVSLVDLAVDRTGVGYERNWVGFNRRRWIRHADAYGDFVESFLTAEFGDRQAQEVLRLETTDHKLKVVRAVARRIWESDFENYSRFTGRKLVYKTGDETLLNIIEGAGGICSEKVQALKFVTDHYGISSELVIAGPDVSGPVPESRLRELLTTFDFRFSKRYMRYWQHLAVLYDIDGTAVLVDATNGNIPFLFLEDAEAKRVLGYDSKAAVSVKMAVRPEDFYYHRVSQDIPRDLLFAMEGWIPYIDLVQVFDNELGLHISSDFLVSPIVFRSEKTFDRLRREYLEVCGREGLQCSISHEWHLDSELGQEYTERHQRVAERIMLAKDHLLARYDDCHGPGHDGGLVVIKLRR